MTQPQAHVEYAENRLGVHSAYEKAETTVTHMRSTRSSLTVIAQEIRSLTSKVETREIDIRVEARQNAPESESVAAFDRRVKADMETDELLSTTRAEISRLASHRDALEQELRQLEFEARTQTARITELGGYLHFLAEAKHLQAIALSFGLTPAVP